MSTHGLHQSALNLCTRIVSVVQDAELRVTTLAVQVEVAILLAVEVDTPLHQLLNLFGSHTHHLLDSLAVADVVAGNHRVLDVLVEIVDSQIGHTGNTTLCERRIGLVETCLANHTHTSFISSRHLQSVAHTCHTSTYYQEIVLINHAFLSSTLQNYKFIL